ncbi:MAG: hypothetical protein WCR20_21640, partial [Verrucomicrobiota bacterium]
MFSDEVTVVQTTMAPDALVTVQFIVPAGCGLGVVAEATSAVKVVVPPNVCGVEALIVTVGTRVEIFMVAI